MKRAAPSAPKHARPLRGLLRTEIPLLPQLSPPLHPLRVQLAAHKARNRQLLALLLEAVEIADRALEERDRLKDFIRRAARLRPAK
jgi:hypothetical protein